MQASHKQRGEVDVIAGIEVPELLDLFERSRSSLARGGIRIHECGEPQQWRFSEGNRQKDTEQYHIFSFDRLRIPDSV